MAITSRVKTLLGLSSSDHLIGSNAGERIYGLGGNDRLFGRGGNDSLYGGPGKDTAIFAGSFADYDFADRTGGLQVSHARGARSDGTDFVASDVECLRFRDLTIDLRVNHRPRAVDDRNGADAVIERGGSANGTPGDATATGNLLANDTDIEVTLGRQTLSIAHPGTIQGIYGKLVVSASGLWTYTLDDGDADTEALAQGQRVNDVFDYVVTDHGGGTDTGRLVVAVTGANDAPEFDDPDDVLTFTVNENEAIGTFVGAAPASDVDDAGLTYAIVGGSGLGRFAIDQNGNITTLQGFDFEANASYDLEVQVSDGNGLTDTAAVTVTINDVLEPVLLGFDDITAGAVQDITSYRGFDFVNARAIDGSQLFASSGYENGTVSPSHVALNLNSDTMQITRPTDFTFVSGYFTAAWNNDLVITVQAFDDGVLKGTQSFLVDYGAPTLVTFDPTIFSSVDTITIASDDGIDANPGDGGTGEHFAGDDWLFLV